MNTYVGFHQDKHGITQLGRIVLDGRIPETEDCTGWELGRMRMLMDQIGVDWDKYANLPSRLPPSLREHHTGIYAEAMVQARQKGWDPELGEDD